MGQPSTRRVPGTSDGPIILVDGACGLCSAAGRFIGTRAAAAGMRVLPRRSPEAGAVWPAAAPPLVSLGDTMILVDAGRVFERSTAVLRAARLMRSPWPVLSLLLVIPRSWRDRAYDALASRRHRAGKLWCPPPSGAAPGER